MSFEKTITLPAPPGSDVLCELISAECECSIPEDEDEQCVNCICHKKISCTVKVLVNVKSKKSTFIEVPLVGCCAPCLCTACPQGWLSPGGNYHIEVWPDRTVSSIKVTWEDGGRCSNGTLYLNGSKYENPIEIPSTPSEYLWEDINKTLTSANISISGGCANIIDCNVIYDPTVWYSIAPNGSFPLPPIPPQVSKISFIAKTDAGETSTVSWYYMEFPFSTSTVHDCPQTITWYIGTALEAADLTIKNDGYSTIYIRNLVTEE